MPSQRWTHSSAESVAVFLLRLRQSDVHLVHRRGVLHSHRVHHLIHRRHDRRISRSRRRTNGAKKNVVKDVTSVAAFGGVKDVVEVRGMMMGSEKKKDVMRDVVIVRRRSSAVGRDAVGVAQTRQGGA